MGHCERAWYALGWFVELDTVIYMSSHTVSQTSVIAS